MRHPSPGHKDDTSSRLTTSLTTSQSSSTTSIARNGKPIAAIAVTFRDGDDGDASAGANCGKIADTFAATFLSDLVDPTEWHQSRKRKERQDSTSSITHDRKLVRSNSEECLTGSTGSESIRRVSSHDNLKSPLQEHNTNVVLRPNDDDKIVNATILPDDDCCGGDNDEERQLLINEELLDVQQQQQQQQKKGTNGGGKRSETSPARSREYAAKFRASPYGEGRHTSRRDHEDIERENERRRNSERFSKSRAPPGRKAPTGSKKLVMMGNAQMAVTAAAPSSPDEIVYKYDDVASWKHERRGFVSRKSIEPNEIHDLNDNNVVKDDKEIRRADNVPWSRSFQEDVPVVCQRFADHTFAHVHSSRADSYMRADPFMMSSEVKSFEYPKNLDNINSRDVLQLMTPAAVFNTPEERLKQISKRVTLLKKRISKYEDRFREEYGYKPSHLEKHNDKSMKNIFTEMHKLRKEKQQIKSDPLAILSVKPVASNGNMVGDTKLAKMKETLTEIEKNLTKKRVEENRTDVLDDLTADQMILEKTAVQRGLLYFESLYGRPLSKDERDAAHPLYDRYRLIKRLVNRSASLTIGLGGGPELPTIHEHEAMAFTASITTPSTDQSELSTSVQSPIDNSASSLQSTESSTDTSSSINENIHTLSVDELLRLLDVVRAEKKQLRRTIKDFEDVFEEQNGRKMLKSDRGLIEETYMIYKQKKARFRLLDALVKKHVRN